VVQPRVRHGEGALYLGDGYDWLERHG
jgi:hypothetical protein